MFAAYQIKGLEDFKEENLKGLAEIGGHSETLANAAVSKSIDRFVKPDGSVDAAAMMDDWFPSIRADVFISHSRADRDLALVLSGWLKNAIGLNPFIDSCVWSHADGLLKKMDNTWCYQCDSNTYSYERRNVSTSHVHMMLATALTKMMDKCECVFFLNTENSVSSTSPEEMISGGENVTRSPWLFHEISMLKLLRRRRLEEYRAEIANFSEGTIQKNANLGLPVFQYPADLEGIPIVNWADMKKWSFRKLIVEELKDESHPLDLLYEFKPPHP